MQARFFFIAAITYLLFFACLLVAKKRGANRLTTSQGRLVHSPWLLLLQAAGLLLFGILPFGVGAPVQPVIFTAAEINTTAALLPVLLLGLTAWVGHRQAVKDQGAAGRPAGSALPFLYLLLYLLLRLLFIVAYEAWFRGLLLVNSTATLGLTLAVAVNTGLYALLHGVNGKREMLACLPFGLVLCGLCSWQGQAWPAITLHLALTLAYELTLLQQHKIFTYARSGYRRFGIHRS